MNNRDSIVLDKLKFFAYHGCLESEKQNGQYFYVSLKLELDLTKPGKSDCLDDTVNYGLIYDCVKDIMTNMRFDLLEALAYTLITRILSDFAMIDKVEVRIDKPCAPGSDGPFPAAVLMSRSRDEI